MRRRKNSSAIREQYTKKLSKRKQKRSNDARERIAEIFGVKARELIFTSGLTEANNLAIIGFARSLQLLEVRPRQK